MTENLKNRAREVLLEVNRSAADRTIARAMLSLIWQGGTLSLAAILFYLAAMLTREADNSLPVICLMISVGLTFAMLQAALGYATLDHKQSGLTA